MKSEIIVRKKDGKRGIVLDRTKKGDLVVTWDVVIIDKKSNNYEIVDS